MRQLFGIALLLCVPQIALADAHVTKCHDDREAGGGNLAQALQLGGRITFKCPAGTTLLMTQEHFINGTTEIDGENNVTLDAQNATNMFRAVSGGHLFTLRNIALRGGGAVPGRPAMIWGVMETVLDRVEVSNSLHPVKIEFRKLTVSNSNFFGNTGPVLEAPHLEVRGSRLVGTLGPALRAAGGQIVLENVQVSGNAATTDRGSEFTNCSLYIRNSQFSNLWSTSSFGGAISSGCRETKITDTTFANNRGFHGGALQLTLEADNVEFRGVTFADNQSSYQGGAVLFDPSPNPGRKLLLVHTIFRNNRADFGGAVSLGAGAYTSFTSAHVLEGTAVSFKGNTASAKGGAIYGTNAGVKLARAMFLDNEAGDGSALMLEGEERPFMLANALVARNKGRGAAIQGDLAGSIVNSTISENNVIGLGSTRRVKLTNTVISSNRESNCRFGHPNAGATDGGTNVQFPGTDCGTTILDKDPRLDSFFVPALDSVLQRAGDNSTCLAQPVAAKDVYGQRRPRADRCAIGAVEGDIEHLVHRVKRTDRQEPR